MKVLAVAALIVAGLSSSAWADPLDEAMQAFERDDYAAALVIWRPLADQGNPRAQTNLGFLYSNGYGVPLDYAEAMGWYLRAAQQGDALAQGSLGFIYAHGTGVSRDLVRAYAWSSLAMAGSTGALLSLFAADREAVARQMNEQEGAQARLLAAELETRIGSQTARTR